MHLFLLHPVYLNLKVVDVFIYKFFTGLTLCLCADISKATARDRIQDHYSQHSHICCYCLLPFLLWSFSLPLSSFSFYQRYLGMSMLCLSTDVSQPPLCFYVLCAFIYCLYLLICFSPPSSIFGLRPLKYFLSIFLSHPSSFISFFSLNTQVLHPYRVRPV
jgi:hypothetical protein